ncbi:MAG: efflux RND transporter periplasmic adaptor subunit [Saprospiraceae bacterium]
MKSYIFSSILLMFIVLAGCGDAAIEPTDSQEENPAETIVTLTPAQEKLAGITIGKASRRNLSEKIGCTAYVDIPPYSLASVYAPVQGFVQQVSQLPGEFVKKGAVLTTLQHPDIINLQQAFLESSSQLDFLEKDFARKQALAASDATSAKVMEQALADLNKEKATQKGLKAQLKLLGVRVDQLLNSGEIQPTIALVAPISGYLTQVNVNQGKLVTPNDLLYEIIDNQHVHLELNVFAKDLPVLKEGQRITAQVPIDQKYMKHLYTLSVSLST